MIQLDTGLLVRALSLGSPKDRRLRDWIGAGETLSMSRSPGRSSYAVPLTDLSWRWQPRSSESTGTSPRITRRLPPGYSTVWDGGVAP